MLLSMTGFSTRTITIPFQNTPVTLTLTLKSVNGRFFEITCKLPAALTALETECIKIFKRDLKRGTTYFTVYASQPAALKGTIQPSFALAQQYVDSLRALQQHCHLEGAVSIHDIAQMPHIFEVAETLIDESALQAFLQELTPLIADLQAERAREGTALKADLQQRVDKLRTLMDQVKPRALEVQHERKKAMLVTLQPFLESSDHTKEQQLQLIYNQLEKLDIHEEIVRFITHLDHFEQVLKAPEQENGKRLDFILQELFREINTMAAKCADAVMSSLTIAMKVEVEKAREQVQNIV